MQKEECCTSMQMLLGESTPALQITNGTNLYDSQEGMEAEQKYVGKPVHLSIWSSRVVHGMPLLHWSLGAVQKSVNEAKA